MKKIALISSYCDSQEKLEILEKNILIIKSLNIDVMLITPLQLSNKIQGLCDYYFYTKDNPVLDWPIKSIYAWRDLNIGDKMIRITKTFMDYGWAGLYQVKKLSEIALSFEYDYFYHMIYDLKINDVVLDGLMKNQDCHIYSSKRDEKIWEVGLHFMSFNRENLVEFIKHIDLDNYLRNNYHDAFSWLLDLKNVFNFNIVKNPVEDEIFIYEGKDYLNLSDIDGLNFFIEKNDQTKSSIKILFYDIDRPKHLDIIVDNIKSNLYLENNTLVDLKFNQYDIKQVILFYEGNPYDITKTINDIKHSTLSYLT